MKLTVGLSDSARTRPLVRGSVAIDGVEPDITVMGVQDLFNKQMVEHTFDACEFPVVTYLRSLEDPARPYLALPIFPSRHFRLSCIFVGADSPVTTPADLAGRRIGVPVFDMAAAVWLRGILQDFHGLDRFAPIYVVAGPEGPLAGDQHPQFYPPGFRFEFRRDAGLAQLLAAGEIDAMVTARAPSTWPHGPVRRLFDAPREVERAYFRATGIFPAMHVLAVKRAVAEKNPEVVGALYRAFADAQACARADLFDSAALDTILPWQLEELLDTERELSADLWACGIEANRRMLNQIIDYSLADGLISTRFTAEDLFTGPGAAPVLTT